MIPYSLNTTYTGFIGHRRITSGLLPNVVLALKQGIENDQTEPILIFDDSTGTVIDVDMHGSEDAVLARLIQDVSESSRANEDDDKSQSDSRSRGRPKLGVVAREVTLLPRHWEWLAEQPGGASVALRKLVEEARRANSNKDKIRKAQGRAYRFMSLVAGNMPNFEEASRALFANDESRFRDMVAEWPEDLGNYAIQLAFSGGTTHENNND